MVVLPVPFGPSRPKIAPDYVARAGDLDDWCGKLEGLLTLMSRCGAFYEGMRAHARASARHMAGPAGCRFAQRKP